MLLTRHYKAWRNFDTKLIVLSKMIAGKTKVMLSPKDLIKVFGPPAFNEFIDGTCMVYNFEDSNLDHFKLLDRYQVSEFYDAQKAKLAHPPYSIRGKKDLPSMQEFYKMEKEAEFWIEHSDYADTEKFVKWLKGKVEKGEDAAERVIKKFGEVEYTNRFGKEYKLSRDYAVFRYNKIKWD